MSGGSYKRKSVIKEPSSLSIMAKAGAPAQEVNINEYWLNKRNTKNSKMGLGINKFTTFDKNKTMENEKNLANKPIVSKGLLTNINTFG